MCPSVIPPRTACMNFNVIDVERNTDTRNASVISLVLPFPLLHPPHMHCTTPERRSSPLTCGVQGRGQDSANEKLGGGERVSACMLRHQPSAHARALALSIRAGFPRLRPPRPLCAVSSQRALRHATVTPGCTEARLLGAQRLWRNSTEGKVGR